MLKNALIAFLTILAYAESISRAQNGNILEKYKINNMFAGFNLSNDEFVIILQLSQRLCDLLCNLCDVL